MKLQLVFLVLLFQFNNLLSQTSLQEIDLDYGRYTIGFKHYTATDSTRTYIPKITVNHKEVLRPIPISIWYPSTTSILSKSPMSVLNYMEVLKEEEEWESLPNYFILDWFYYANTPQNQQHLKETAQAYIDIPIAKESFPVIIYAPSFQASSIENFAICEQLASHGYIVISSPSRGASSKRFQKPERAIETQARDLEFLIKEVSRFPSSDMNRVATMGFSFGGLSNVLTQMRTTIFKANLSLDGTIRYNPDLLKSTAFYDPKKITIPFMHLAQKEIPQAVMQQENISATLNTDFEFYDALTHCDAYKMRFHDMSHSYFSTLGVLFEKRDLRQDKSDQKIMASYKLVSTYSLQFMNAYLKDDATALQFITNTPQENNISSDLISKESKTATVQKAFDFYDFVHQAKLQNYKNVKTFYKQIKKTHPTLELPEGRLNTLGLQLIFNPKNVQAGISIFELALQLYPTSANLYDSLAEGYLYIGDTKNAIYNFEKSLSLNPDNQNATKRLKELNP
ncbi:alpha/beta hydrolase [Dokdonia sp.]|uniref:dienelactone hydrolase family protein n=1 Tax=Dokdonia sp. TaxID=2024995 RepID=UPI003263F9E8